MAHLVKIYNALARNSFIFPLSFIVLESFQINLQVVQETHLIKRLRNAVCTCRSSPPTCASYWESQPPHGITALPTLHRTLGPCSWRKRVGQVSGQTASPTSSPWMASITEREPGMNHNTEGVEGEKKKPETCQCRFISPTVSSPWLWRYTHGVGHMWALTFTLPTK